MDNRAELLSPVNSVGVRLITLGRHPWHAANHADLNNLAKRKDSSALTQSNPIQLDRFSRLDKRPAE
jgi:hypothetical protein